MTLIINIGDQTRIISDAGSQVQVMIDPYSHASPDLMYSPRNIPGAGCDRYDVLMSVCYLRKYKVASSGLCSRRVQPGVPV